MLTIPAGAASGSVHVDVYSKEKGAEKATFSLHLTHASGPLVPELVEPPEEFPVGDHPQVVIATDINGDGWPDLVTLDDAVKVSILLNTTADGALKPSFGPRTSFPAGVRPEHVAAADLNGDGKQDLVITDIASGTVSVFLNLTPDASVEPLFAPGVAFDAGTQPNRIASADFDRDGKPDLVIGNGPTIFFDNPCPGCEPTGQSVAVLLNTTPTGSMVPSFTARENFRVDKNIKDILAVDLGLNSRPEILVDGTHNRSRSSTLSVLFDASDFQSDVPVFEAGEQHFDTFGSAGIAVADFNDDGRLDLATGVVGLSIYLACNCSSVVAFENQAQPVESEELTPIDLDGDGRRELLPLRSADLTLLRRNGALADLTGDDRPEVVGAISSSDTLVVGVLPFLPVTLSKSVATGTILPNNGTVPRAFNFTDQRGVSTARNTISNTVTVRGLSNGVATTLTLTRRSGANTAFSVNGGAFAKGTAMVRNGDRVRLRNRVAAGKTNAIAAIDIGGVVDTWKISTRQ